MILEFIINLSSAMLYGTTLNSCNNDILSLLSEISYIKFTVDSTIKGLM